MSNLVKTLITLAFFFVSRMILLKFGRKSWDPKGKHVYITGGSQGLGLALAKILVKRGANISIVARTQSKLDSALRELEALRVSPAQSFKALSFSLSTAQASAEALAAATVAHDEFPDAIFCCAGSVKPKFFVDMSEEELAGGMTNGYWVQAWTAWAGVKEMVKRGKKAGLYSFLQPLDSCHLWATLHTPPPSML